MSGSDQGGPALLVGSEPRIVLTVARSLARHGIASIVARPLHSEPWVPSRSVRRSVALAAEPEARAAELVALAHEERAGWIAACSDSALQLVGRVDAPLRAIAPVSAPPPAVVAAVLDKARTHAVAASVDVPVPVQFRIPSRDALAELAGRLPFPLVAKPADKRGRPTAFKALYVADAAALDRAFAQDAGFGEGVLFQEYVPGVGVGVHLLMREGQALAAFQHRRLRELPPSGGVAVAAVAETADPMLVVHAVRLLQALEWRGVAMVEFRYDPATRRAVLMEVNGRFWGSIALAVQAGYDFPYWQWQLDHGLSPSVPAGYRAGQRLQWIGGDLQRVGQLLGGAAPGADGARWPAALAALGADLLRPATHAALWSWRDPAPALRESAQAARHVVRAIARKVVRAAARGLLPRSWWATVSEARILGGRRARLLLRARALRALGWRRYRLPAQPRRVLFVCHGNIMRSAAAEALLRARLRAAGRDDVAVASAGAHARRGRPAHAAVLRAAHARGIDLGAHASQPLSDELVAWADLILVMDDRNLADVVTRHPAAAGKVMPLGGLRPTGAYCGLEIADPYERGDAAVRLMLDEVARGVELLAQALDGQGGVAVAAPATAAPAPADGPRHRTAG